MCIYLKKVIYIYIYIYIRETNKQTTTTQKREVKENYNKTMQIFVKVSKNISN